MRRGAESAQQKSSEAADQQGDTSHLAPHASGVTKLSIIICAYNERRTILEAIAQAHAVELPPGWEKEVIVVDNDSTDGTREMLQTVDTPGVRVILHPRNLGKSASILTGFREAGGDYGLVFDADLEYEAADIPRLVAAVTPGETVAVFGSRTLGGRKIYLYAQNYWAVRGLTALANRLFGGHLTDIATGPKLVRVDVVRSLNLSYHEFDLDFDLPCKLLKNGYKIEEIAINYHPRSVAQGKGLAGWKAIYTGLRVLWIYLKVLIGG
ncbi:MAG TPA: glycosyltransferase family 2 protein [Anaerolineae bacterium]|nr:glycosyltransferase family 2 protein [Anaerolineae bacterium]HQH38854.1 glycosyltransferase family 2 protein [Anaerolineae bacterium]